MTLAKFFGPTFRMLDVSPGKEAPSSGWGASEGGASVSRADQTRPLHSAVVGEVCCSLLLPTSPSGRYRLVALSPSKDLFFRARDLFVRAKPLWGSINGGSIAAREDGNEDYDKFSLPTGSGFTEYIFKMRARRFITNAEFDPGGPQCFSCNELKG